VSQNIGVARGSKRGADAPMTSNFTPFLPRCMECRRGLAMGILSVRPSVCLPVRLSNAWIVTKRKKNQSRFLCHIKDHLAQFSEKKNGWWGATPSTWNVGSTDSRWSEIADFEQIIARSPSAVTPREKSSINTNKKSPIRAFQWAYDDHRTLPLSPPKGAQKRKTAVHPLKSQFAWRKSATKFFCVKTVSGNVVGYSLA